MKLELLLNKTERYASSTERKGHKERLIVEGRGLRRICVDDPRADLQKAFLGKPVTKETIAAAVTAALTSVKRQVEAEVDKRVVTEKIPADIEEYTWIDPLNREKAIFFALDMAVPKIFPNPEKNQPSKKESEKGGCCGSKPNTEDSPKTSIVGVVENERYFKHYQNPFENSRNRGFCYEAVKSALQSLRTEGAPLQEAIIPQRENAFR